MKFATADFIKSIIMVGANKWMKDKMDELEEWFIEEVNSEDGLTWDEFKEKIDEILEEYNYSPLDDIWKSLK